jgi:hypothetical protein
LTKERREAVAERDQYYEESRHSAKILGGILRVMAENDMYLEGLGPIIREHLLPDDASALREAAARPRRFTRAVSAEPQKFHAYLEDTPLGARCSCGAQWLVHAERCVTQPVGL